MVSLVNAERIKKGLSTLGWLNPSIYAANGLFTNDITVGNNNCVAGSHGSTNIPCCPFGFEG